MATITEDYVSFETAGLLKEKGFDEKCFALYNPDGILIQSGIRLNNTQVGRVKGSYCAPTLQMAMKWLREVHKIHIGINPISEKGYNATIYGVADFDDCGVISDSKFFFHVEEACEAAIKHCLENLI